jgi:DNA (cytosine-5)-methyltransferase 1
VKYFLDLFSGIGGFALGAEWAGLKFDGYYHSDIDDYANKVYAKRFPESINLGDICGINGRDLPSGDWVIAGGFPCQDISTAGKGAGLDGARSGLWFEYARLIGELRPGFAIMENVGALTRRGLDRVLGSLAEIGYDAEWQDIRASDVGAPHRRERIWIVAYPTSSKCDAGTEVAGKLLAVQGNRIKHDNTDRSSQDVADANAARPQRQCKSSSSAKAHPWTRSTYERAKQIWATEPDVGRVANGIPSRVDRLKCLGNSIVPQIAAMIFSQKAFDGYRIP